MLKFKAYIYMQGANDHKSRKACFSWLVTGKAPGHLIKTPIDLRIQFQAVNSQERPTFNFTIYSVVTLLNQAKVVSDQQITKVLIVYQILLINTIENIRSTVRRIYMQG